MQRPLPSQLKILVVDQNPLLRRTLRDMLRQCGMGDVVSAANGADAKELLRREPYDLLVIDWANAPVNGPQLVNWVRRSPGSLYPELPIIVLISNADVVSVRAAWEAGADSVLAKPVSSAAVARRIETVLRRPRHTRNAGETTQPAQPNPTPPAAPPERLAITSEPFRLRLPPPGVPVPTADPKRMRLLLALDRLEAALENPDSIGTKLRHAVSELQAASAGNHAVAAIVASLSTCATWVEPDTESFADAIHAHAAALRWMAFSDNGPDTQAMARCLIRSLRAMVRTLTSRGPADASLCPDFSPAARRPDGTGDCPLPPA